MYAAPSIQKLLDELERLPGIGPKSAQRIAYWILNTDKATALRLSEAIAEVKDQVHFCRQCFNYAEDDLCEICRSSRRDPGIICVVSEPRDIPPIERTAVFSGLYHVLGGALSPMEGIGPDNLRIAELMKRLKYSHIISKLCKISRTCKTRRPGTDYSNFVSVLLFCTDRFNIMIQRIIRNKSFKFSD